MKPKAVGYVRVSTAEQAREGWSLAAQRKRIKAYAESRGWRLARIYADEGVSGATKRPEFERMVRDVLADGVQHIIALKLDRLGRSAKSLLDFYERLERKGVGIVTIEDGVDTSTANGRMMRTILAALAEWERDMIGQRTRNGLAQAKAQGKKLGRPPYGWRAEDGRMVRDPDEQAVIREIRAMDKRGESLAAIARHLNEAGKAPDGARWHPQTVARVLARSERPKSR